MAHRSRNIGETILLSVAVSALLLCAIFFRPGYSGLKSHSLLTQHSSVISEKTFDTSQELIDLGFDMLLSSSLVIPDITFDRYLSLHETKALQSPTIPLFSARAPPYSAAVPA
ncbi:MAG: hypothetical protein M0T70_14055 [Geobacteraceae bacterium]|nr:hypothetical protein [Geobacteraceae bacterium]